MRATHRKVERGDTLGVTVIPRYQGYHEAVGRPISVGRPSPELAEAVDLAVEAQNAVLKALKPGAIGREVEQKARKSWLQRVSRSTSPMWVFTPSVW